MEDVKLPEVHARLPKDFGRPDAPWYRYVNIDLVAYILSYTLFHPWASWILVLCLRAQLTPYENIEMRLAMAWAFLMSAIGIFGIISDKMAFGNPREVDLSEEVIIVTGGVDGLGGLLADTYGMRNANVAVLDTQKVDENEAEEKGVVYYNCDVGNAAQVEATIKQIAEDMGPPTILINNAGIVRPKSILESTAQDVEDTFRVNTLSHFHTLRNVLPHMFREQRGTIVTVSSVLGHLGAANLAAYTASKAALLALHHSLRAEIAQHPDGKEIKTILVTPGQMSTKMFADLKTPSNFFAPIIAPVDVAKHVIRLIERGEGGEVAVPLYSNWISLLGVQPAGVQTLLRRWSGVDTAIAKSGLTEKTVDEKSR